MDEVIGIKVVNKMCEINEISSNHIQQKGRTSSHLSI